MGRARQVFLVLLLTVVAFGAVRAAVDGAWVPAGLMALMSLFAGAMLWASSRQSRLGRRDKPALLVFAAVPVLVIVLLVVLNLAA